MIRLVGQLLWASAVLFILAGAMASVIVTVALVVMHAAWWWKDRKWHQITDLTVHSKLADEVEEFLRGQ